MTVQYMFYLCQFLMLHKHCGISKKKKKKRRAPSLLSLPPSILQRRNSTYIFDCAILYWFVCVLLCRKIKVKVVLLLYSFKSASYIWLYQNNFLSKNEYTRTCAHMCMHIYICMHNWSLDSQDCIPYSTLKSY